MNPSRLIPLTGLLFGLLAGCSSEPGAEFDGGLAEDAAVADVAPIDFGDVNVVDAGDGGACEAPDFLVVLDRSASMGAAAGKTSDGGALPSKWSIATGALNKIVGGTTDETLRFGLEVFPDVAGACSSGTVLVQPALSRGPMITNALATTTLLSGTPMGAPLAVARKALASTKVSGRKQFILLVTDGGETCTTEKALPAVQALAGDGVKTYVVGFGAAVNVAQLNNLACAGGTAPSQKTACVATQNGWEWDGKTPNLFFQAQDKTTLEKALAAVAGTTCCGCIVN